MVAINFPDSPTNGQEHAGYVWDATNNVWNRLPTLPALDLINFSAVAPSNPQDGQFWFDTTVGKMYVYYNDGSSSQWVSAIGGFHELNAIGDVSITSATAGQALTYNGTNWVNGNGLVAVKDALFTGVQDASVPAGGNVAVTDLSITHEVANASNKLIISAFLGAASNDIGFGNVGLAVHDGTGLIAVGASPGSRVAVTAGGAIVGTASTTIATMPSVTFVHTPGAGSKTYTVRAININTATDTVHINRAESDTDVGTRFRAVSSLVIQEVSV